MFVASVHTRVCGYASKGVFVVCMCVGACECVCVCVCVCICVCVCMCVCVVPRLLITNCSCEAKLH